MPIPYQKNTKKHPDKQLLQIAKSIKEFGWRQPIVVDKDDIIIVGHGRWFAWEKYGKELGLPEPKIERADDLTEDQVSAYRLADNKLNESEWDMGLVIEELKGLSSEMFDLTGFDRDLLIEPDEKDDVIPEDVETRAKLGDIWQLGKHRIMCGDSTKKEDVERLMDGKNADMVFTDPPYGVNYEGKTEDKLKIENDKSVEAFNGAISNFDIKLGGVFYICCPSGANFKKFIEIFEKECYQSQTIIWVKNSMVLGHGDYHYQHEPILYGWKKGGKHDFFGDRTWKTVWKIEPTDKQLLQWAKNQLKTDFKNKTTVWKIDRPSRSESHPTMKPVALIERAIINSSKQEDIILDLFLGSGSTLIACEKTNRICIGMELDPKYVDVIIQRYEDYTGNKAIKIT